MAPVFLRLERFDLDLHLGLVAPHSEAYAGYSDSLPVPNYVAGEKVSLDKPNAPSLSKGLRFWSCYCSLLCAEAGS